jgi:hypothetical protein
MPKLCLVGNIFHDQNEKSSKNIIPKNGIENGEIENVAGSV